MARPEIIASDTPLAGSSTSKRSLRSVRTLVALGAALALALAVAAPAVAAGSETSGYGQTPTTPTAGYGQTPTTPTTTTTTTTTAKESPKQETAPAKQETAPSSASTSPASSKSTTLPFTGLNLTWVIAAGFLLVGAGVSMRVVARRRS
jgi:hypothetical protein